MHKYRTPDLGIKTPPGKRGAVNNVVSVVVAVEEVRYLAVFLIGDKRIASRIGSGSFNNVYGQNGNSTNENNNK